MPKTPQSFIKGLNIVLAIIKYVLSFLSFLTHLKNNIICFCAFDLFSYNCQGMKNSCMKYTIAVPKVDYILTCLLQCWDKYENHLVNLHKADDNFFQLLSLMKVAFL